jgi:hypothetical protein
MLKLFQHDHKPSFQSKVTMKTFVVLSLAIVATLALPKSPLNETWVQFKVSVLEIYTKTSISTNFFLANPPKRVQLTVGRNPSSGHLQ